MIELPEAITLSKQLRRAIQGKTVAGVLSPTKAHKFCWFCGDPKDYDKKLAGQRVCASEAFAAFVEIAFEGGQRLCFNDGVNVRFISGSERPEDYQLLVAFSDGTSLQFTVAMYGGIYLHDGDFDNEYYLKSRAAISPFSEEFFETYERVLAQSKPNLSVKAFLATEQRFPGIGNGVLQDILFCARLHPKRKLQTLNDAQRCALFASVVSALQDMTARGGRDTEKGLFGNFGGYVTQMSKNTLAKGCPVCGGAITKEAYLGGSVYYCANCQPLVK